MSNNYSDVLDQLTSAGLQVQSLEIGRIVRCRVDDDREKRGWYRLSELQTIQGDTLIGGSYGVWRGDDNNFMRISVRKTDLNAQQRASLRKCMADDRRRAIKIREKEAERAAIRAGQVWRKCSPTGESDYLIAKGVLSHGLRYSPSGALVIPMLDTAGKIHGLQIVRGKSARRPGRPAKEYWPAGMSKRGHFHLLGIPSWVVLVAEGYATAASLHEATGLPVAVTFDAGNIGPVSAAIRKRYRCRVLICADDDLAAKCPHCQARIWLPDAPKICPGCNADHRRGNTGVMMASSAAMEVEGAWVKPQFADESARRTLFMERGRKRSDFNDVHADEGLHVVRTQIEFRLSELSWRPRSSQRAESTPGGQGSDALRPIESLDELLERYALVYGQGGTVFDRDEHCILTISDMRDACIQRQLHRAWAEHPERSIVRVREVGFDPGGTDPAVTCNLWGGWPTEPRSGVCERLLELLRYMCSEEKNTENLYRWVLRWIAYPIQHPGAKMKSTLVLHGPQGTGKNLFFESVMAIYGHYGRIIDQSAIEDRFNDWASRKLFLIADEVVARSDLYHVKNKLKAFITGDWIRINPKNMAAYDERNHVNLVFLSNETMPVVIDHDDRRHTIIWTPEKLDAGFYSAVLREISEGGIEALHDYLLHLDLGDFSTSSLPTITAAKTELIDLSLDSTSRFFLALCAGDIGHVTARPALSEDVYDLYRAWCTKGGHRAAPMPRLINAISRKHHLPTVRKRYMLGSVMRGPHSVLPMGTESAPEWSTDTDWLGQQIEAFKLSLSDYKGAVYG